MGITVEPVDAKATIGGRNLSELINEIQAIYLGDTRPWVIGFSGGKDSTSVLRLVYTALLALKPAERSKPIFVVSSDTLVETPMVIDLITNTLRKVETDAQKRGLSLSVAQVTPDMTDTFWVNLLGRGYPAPTKQFRWCTERMKIDPVSNFVRQQVATFGEVVIVLGSRSSESATRAQVIRNHKIEGQRLARHTSLPSAYVYTPIEGWSTDDVWEYLFSGPAPWGDDHKLLIELYRDSNAGECPLVVDNSTPSCGNSRFGCWVCTVVTEDKAMQGLIASGETWLQPLHEFRELLAKTTKPENKNEYRNFKRRTGQVHLSKECDSHIPGPYKLHYRKEFLWKLLEAQRAINNDGKDFELIKEAELQEIRKHWIQDPIEPDWEDSLPRIYREVLGKDLDWAESDAGVFTKHDSDLLHELGKKYQVSPELVMKLLEVELSLDGLSKRAGLLNRIDQVLTQEWGTLSDAMTKQREIGKTMGVYAERDQDLRDIYEKLRT